jgi:uncharacterized protein (TIGR00269 family)
MKWQTEYLARQAPVLDARAGFPRKTKPLVRLSEREMAAYCILRGIDYIVDECPMAAGNRHLGYKEILNDLEARSPGAKADFYFNFLRSGAQHFTMSDAGDAAGLGHCERCGAPASGAVCAFCRLVERAGGSQPVELLSTRRGSAP